MARILEEKTYLVFHETGTAESTAPIKKKQTFDPYLEEAKPIPTRQDDAAEGDRGEDGV